MTKGYRKIPGNKCVDGVDLNPTVYACSYSGWLMNIFSIKAVLYLMVVAAALYFGWNYVEAILIALPIPDPKDVKERVGKLFNKEGSGSSGAVKKSQGYS